MDFQLSLEIHFNQSDHPQGRNINVLTSLCCFSLPLLQMWSVDLLPDGQSQQTIGSKPGLVCIDCQYSCGGLQECCDSRQLI